MPEPRHDEGNTATSVAAAATPAAAVNDAAQHPDRSLCPVCWTPFTRVGRQRYCTDACRKTDWTRRHTAATRPSADPVAPRVGRRNDVTIYACPSCQTRYHGQQRCHDCNQPCTRVGLGGLCPHCEKPVALAELLDTNQPEIR